MMTGVFVLLAIGAVLLYMMYASLSGRVWNVRFTPAQIEQRLAAKMPLSKSLHALQGTVERPRIAFKEGTDRVYVGVDFVLQFSPASQTMQLKGAVNASSAIRYAPGTGQIFLAEPLVESIAIPGLSPAMEGRARTLVGQLLSQLYADRPIYTFADAAGKGKAAQMLIKQAVVENGELVITLGLP